MFFALALNTLPVALLFILLGICEEYILNFSSQAVYLLINLLLFCLKMFASVRYCTYI
jgi:hypothetical protein